MARRPQATEGDRWRFVVVFASFTINLLSMALTRCMGVLFASFQNAFSSNAAETGAISSITSATSLFGSAIGGVLVNRFGCRHTAILGGLLHTVGAVGGALSQTLHQMYVVGAIAGLGAGIAFTPAVVMVARSFDKHYTLATAFMTIGNSGGFMIFGPFMQLLLDTYGWRGALLITGALSANMCTAGAVYRPVGQKRKLRTSVRAENQFEPDDDRVANPMIDTDTRESEPANRKRLSLTGFLTKLLKPLRLNLLSQSYCFSAFCLSKTVVQISFGSFLLYIIPYATNSGVSDQSAAILLSVYGIAGLVGRPLCGLIGQKVSAFLIYEVALFCCACGVLVVQGGSYGYFVVSAAITGLAFSFHQTIAPPLVREFVGVDNMGSAVGIYSCMAGVSDLTGPILAGALYDATNSFPALFYLFAGTFLLGCLATLPVPCLKKIELVIHTKTDAEDV